MCEVKLTMEQRVKAMQSLNPNLSVKDACLLLGIDYDEYLSKHGNKANNIFSDIFGKNFGGKV